MSYQQIAYITVKVVMIGNCNPYEVIENVDYGFDDPAIIETEIVGVED